MKNKFLLLTLVVVLFGFGSLFGPFAKAQSQPNPFGNRGALGETDEVYYPPAVFVLSSKINNIDTKNRVEGSFRTINRSGNKVGDLRYRFELLGALDTPADKNEVVADNTPLYDKVTSEDLFALGENEEKEIKFSYQAPSLPAGTYRLRIQLTTSKNRDLGWRDQTVVFNKTAVNFAKLVAEKIKTAEYPGIFIAPMAGPNLSQGSQFELVYSITSQDKKTTELTPVLDIYEFNNLGKKLETITGNKIAFSGTKKQEFSFPVKASSLPGVYQAELRLKDSVNQQTISAIGEYHWIVRGQGAHIVSARIEDLRVNKDEKMGVVVDFGGSADAETKEKATMRIDISDDKGLAGSFTIPETLDLSDSIDTGKANVTLNRDLVGKPSLYVVIKDLTGKILDEYTVKMPLSDEAMKAPKAEPVAPSQPVTVTKQSPFALRVTVAVIVLVLIVAIIIYLVIKKKGDKTKTTVLVLLLGISLFGLGNYVYSGNNNPPAWTGNGIEVLRPASFRQDNSDWWHNGTKRVTEVFVNEPIHNMPAGTYEKGAVPLSFRIEFGICTNRTGFSYVKTHYAREGGLSSNFRPPVDSTGNYAHYIESSYDIGFSKTTDSGGSHGVDARSFVAPNGINLSQLPNNALNTTLRFVAEGIWNTDNYRSVIWDEGKIVAGTFFDGTIGYDNLQSRLSGNRFQILNIWLNFAPLACTATPAQAVVGDTVNLQTTGGILTSSFYQWLIDGTTVNNTRTVSHVFNSAGSKTITIKKMNCDPATLTKTRTCPVTQTATCTVGITTLPALSCSASSTETTAGDSTHPITLTATGGNPATSYSWSYTHNSAVTNLPSTTGTATFVPPTEGAYTATVAQSTQEATCPRITATNIPVVTSPIVTLQVNGKSADRLVKSSNPVLTWTVDTNPSGQCTASATPTNSAWNGTKNGTAGVTNTQTITNLQRTTSFSIECNGVTKTVPVTVTNPDLGTGIIEL